VAAEAFGDTGFFQTPKGRLRWAARGLREAPPLLVIHGMGDTLGSWAQAAPALAAKYRVHLVDLPGHLAAAAARALFRERCCGRCRRRPSRACSARSPRRTSCAPGSCSGCSFPCGSSGARAIGCCLPARWSSSAGHLPHLEAPLRLARAVLAR
jgi:pimeloyl-ACP methyl ester carboxylesterase